PIRQYDGHPVASAYADAAQPVKRIVRRCPERAICDRQAPGPQDGIAVGGGSRMAGKKISQARKGMTPGVLACRSVLQAIDNLGQGPSEPQHSADAPKPEAPGKQDQGNDRSPAPASASASRVYGPQQNVWLDPREMASSIEHPTYRVIGIQKQQRINSSSDHRSLRQP